MRKNKTGVGSGELSQGLTGGMVLEQRAPSPMEMLSPRSANLKAMKLSARVYNARIAESDTEVMFTTGTLGVQLFDPDGKLIQTIPWTSVRGWTKSIVRMKSGKIELWLTLDVFDKSKGKTKSSHEMEFAMAEQDVDDACELMRQTTSQIKTARDDISSAKKQRELRAEQELVHEQISILSPRGRRNPHARPGPAAPALYDVTLDDTHAGLLQLQVTTMGLSLYKSGRSYETFVYKDLRRWKVVTGGLSINVKGKGDMMLRTTGAAKIAEDISQTQAKLSSRSKSSKQVLDASTVGVQPDKGELVFVLTELLNLRPYPSTSDSEPLTILSKGDCMTATGGLHDGNWVQVTVNGGKTVGWVLTTDTKANFVGTREELIAQRTAEEAKARSTVNRGMSLSGLDQGLMAGSSGGGSSSRGSRGSPSPAAFMSPRTAAGAAMSASQDTFRCTLDKNKKVVLTVGSVGVQIFNVERKGKVSLSPTKTITFTSLLKWSKRISRAESKVWVVLRITSVAPSVFFKTTNAPAEEMRIEMASGPDADKFLQRMGETALLIKEARDQDAVNEVTSLMGESYSPRTATSMARKMTIEAKDSIGSPRWRAMQESDRLKAVKLTAAAHSSMLKKKAPPPPPPPAEEYEEEDEPSGGSTPRGPPPPAAGGLDLVLMPEPVQAAKPSSPAMAQLRAGMGAGGGSMSPAARAVMSRKMKERAARMAAESISTEERANARAMSAELEDIKQQINDLTPRSRAREIAKQSKIAMGYRGEDDYGMEDEVDDLGSPSAAGFTSI